MKIGLVYASLLASGVFVAGCGTLIASPGDDFRVAVAERDIALVQRVGNYDLEFTLDGCDQFDADLSVNGGKSRRLEPRSLGGNRFVATVPIEWLHSADAYCIRDTRAPERSDVLLEATCRQDQRVAFSQVQVDYALAWRATARGRGPVDALLPATSEGRFWEMGSGWLNGVFGDSFGGPEIEAHGGSRSRPLLVESSNESVHLWTACPINDCGPFLFDDSPGSALYRADLVQVFKLEGDRIGFVKNIPAPRDAVDFVADGEGALLLSDGALTRFGDESATVVARFGETPTKFATLDGKRAFLTRADDGKTRLRNAQGTLLAELVTPGSGEIQALSLAPTGDLWVTIRGGEAWISTYDRVSRTATSTLLASQLAGLLDPNNREPQVGVAWTNSGVVLRDDTGVEVFEPSAPFARRWQASSAERSIVSVEGVGDSIVLLTHAGLSIFDVAGNLTGGADLNGASCFVNYRPEHLAVIGPDTVALAGRNVTYQFKTGDVGLEVSR